MSCCPPNSHKYLEASYDTVGSKITRPNGYEYYISGGSAAGKTAVIIVPDVWGWNSGRTRAIADMFAESGYFAIVPKLMVKQLLSSLL
jgi:dienelactone hydrolase